MYFVYVVQCSDGTYYIGITNDLKRRVKEHNESKKGAKYTKNRRPVILKYSEHFLTINAALKREYQLKQLTKKEKIALIKSS